MKCRNIAVVAALVTGASAWGQQGPPNEDLEDNRPETWALQYYTSLVLPTTFGPARPLETWKMSLGLEVDQIPWLSEEERRVGFNGMKVEDLNHAPILVRPNLTIGLPRKWSASFAYLPPIEAFDVRTDLYGVSLQRSFGGEGPWRFALRVFAQYSKVRGAFTCSREVVEAGPDSPLNPYGCEAVSNDAVRMRVAGVEASVAYRLDRFYGLTPFGGVTWQDLNMDFEVDARRRGFRDHRYLYAETGSWTVTVGARLPLGNNWEFGAAVLHAPIDVQRPGQSEPHDEAFTALRTQLTYFFDVGS